MRIYAVVYLLFLQTQIKGIIIIITKKKKSKSHGWAPDPPMVGIRSPLGLVVGSCTRHPGVLGSIPKREEPGKTGAPCVKVPGSSRVPAPPWVGSRSPDGWDQIPYRPGGWVLHQPPWSFGFDSQTRGTRENRRTLCKSTGFLTGPSPAMVGSRSPDGWDQIPYRVPPANSFVIGPAVINTHLSCTSHPGVLGSIPGVLGSIPGVLGSIPKRAPKRSPALLPRRAVPSDCICRCS